MDRIKAKLDDTTLTAISVGNFVKNAERLRKKRAVEAAERERQRQMSLCIKREASTTSKITTNGMAYEQVAI